MKVSIFHFVLDNGDGSSDTLFFTTREAAEKRHSEERKYEWAASDVEETCIRIDVDGRVLAIFEKEEEHRESRLPHRKGRK